MSYKCSFLSPGFIALCAVLGYQDECSAAALKAALKLKVTVLSYEWGDLFDVADYIDMHVPLLVYWGKSATSKYPGTFT